jgi:hypothetical protein
VQAGQAVGQPADGIALAAAGRVLDEVVPANAAGAGVGFQQADRLPLVEARKDHRFLAHLPAADGAFLDL